MEALDGLPPVKVHCSLLAEEAIHAALWDYAQKNGITIEGLEKPKDNIEEEEEEEPLDEIILKINEKFKGEFTNADRVLLTALHDRLLADPKLAKLARSSDPQIFTESIFPKAFDTAAQDSYLEAQDTFASLFEDTSKYKAIMSALAEWLYGEFRKK